ncbi:MAG: pantetheine-phosphate adenylyltransferase [Bacteroidota bacterium]
MKKIALFPGSFDPITKGHESIIRRAITLFDKLIIGLGVNNEKKGFFPIEQRKNWIIEVFKDEPKIEVQIYDGLTVDYCEKVNAKFLLRGLRTSADFEFERSIGQVNKQLHPDIETIFLLTAPEHTALNSSIVRDVLKYGGDVSKFVPEAVNKDLPKYI